MMLALLAPARHVDGQRTIGGEPWTGLGDTMTVVMLGTGMPAPNPERSGPATAVVAGTRVFVFDAGPGVMRRLAAARLPIDGPAALFLTHLHTDHTLGLPDIIFTSWVMGRSRPMRIFGPRGTRAMTDHLAAAWAEDVDIRTNGLERGRPGGQRVDARDVMPGVLYDSAGVRITAIAVPHGSWKQALAYRVDGPRKSVVISGDTRYSPELARAASGADILIHEAYASARVKPENRPGGDAWPKYMKSFHTSDEEVGRVAARAKVKLLVLYHIVGPYTPEELMAGVRRGGYRGRVVIASDLDRF
ncbi:MAG: Ribonuclease BN [Gemmatimonadaceae bacterium]|nr:Ribonuclease BN [Gemmatimonadaceae bacterium]